METHNDIRKMQELLLSVLPLWCCNIDKPLKQILDNGMSLGTYYCLQTLRYYDRALTMSELASYMNMSKQQLTKLVNRLVELNFVERIPDPNDRRVIKIQTTETALEYIGSFLDNDMKYFKTMFENMSEDDRYDFQKALETLMRVFLK